MTAVPSPHEGVNLVALCLALARIRELEAAIIGAMDILGRAESNASGTHEWDHVGPRVAAARAVIAKATA